MEDVERSELHNFNVDRLLVKEVQDALQTATTKAKIRRYEEFDSHSTECELARSQKFYFNKMRKAAEKIPVTGLLPEWEENIRKLTNRSQLSCKYMHIFEEKMRETKERYYKTMRNMAICRIIAVECEDKYDEDSFVVSSYKYSGRTQLAAKFLKNRRAFAKQYYLSHRLIRSIVAKAHRLLPEIFCDLGYYRNLDFLPIDKLFNSVEADLKKSIRIVVASYYSDIVRLVSQRRYTQDVPTSILARFLKCATNLLGLQIITRAIDTIEHLLNVLADQTTIPLLKLELKCESDDLFVSPRLEEVYNAFHNLVDEIANIARRLSPLESWIFIKRRQRKKEGKGTDAIDVDIIANNNVPFASPPDWYLREAHQRLSVILQESFQPLSNYLEGLWLQFGSIIYKTDKALHNAVMYTEKKHFLQDYFAKVEDYNRLIRVINGLPDNEYLVTVKLHQAVAKHGLVTSATELRKLVIDELVKHHWNYNLEICDTFETLKERALNVPQTTRELLELGQYMLTATSTLMVELQNKIKFSLRMMSSLIELTTLSRHHIELNNTTVQWLKRIRSVFERSSVMYEQNKFELEEKLQEEAVKLNERVEDMFPRLVIMNNMDDVERIKEYIGDMRKMVCQLKRMEQKAEWINAEEALFKFPLTLYPRIKELKENIFPFYALIHRGYQWQRDRKAWLDGSFEFLDVEHIDNKLNQYLSDFIKIGKQYKTKIQLQNAINYPYSFSGLIDDPDPFQQPAPLKLCHQLIEDVKWLKEYVPLLKILRNPEISQLHWDNGTSTMAEFDLTIDAGTTLRKIINIIFINDSEQQ